MLRAAAFITFLCLVLLGLIYIGQTPATSALPASPTVAEVSSSSFWPEFWTWTYTYVPYYGAMAAILAAVLLLVFGFKKFAIVLAALLAAGAIAYFFHPTPICASNDVACNAVQAQKKAEKAAEEQKKAQQQAAAAKAAQEKASLCANTLKPLTYSTAFAVVDGWDTCTLSFDAPGHCIKVWVDGEPMPRPEQYCQKPGEAKIIPNRVKLVRSDDAGGVPFIAHIIRAPRALY